MSSIIQETEKEKKEQVKARTGIILDHSIQNKIFGRKAKDLKIRKTVFENTGIIVDKNRWMLVTIILSITLLFSIAFLAIQITNNNHNTKLFIVKLATDGTYTEEFLEEKTMPTYFLNTVNSLLRQYVERRYSERQETIISDYGFSYHFMSPRLRNQFMNEFHAVKSARDFKNCNTCMQKRVTVDAIQHNETDEEILDAKPLKTYRTSIFATSTIRHPDGSLNKRTKQIITLLWRIRTLKELNANLKSLSADPIGIEIIRESIKNAPKTI